MATEQCTADSQADLVELKWREVYGPIAECQALLELRMNVDDDVSWSTLASASMSRLVDLLDELDQLELRHGRKSLDERLGVAGRVDHPQ